MVLIRQAMEAAAAGRFSSCMISTEFCALWGQRGKDGNGSEGCELVMH
jgi:hypothetical protein